MIRAAARRLQARPRAWRRCCFGMDGQVSRAHREQFGRGGVAHASPLESGLLEDAVGRAGSWSRLAKSPLIRPSLNGLPTVSTFSPLMRGEICRNQTPI